MVYGGTEKGILTSSVPKELGGKTWSLQEKGTRGLYWLQVKGIHTVTAAAVLPFNLHE